MESETKSSVKTSAEKDGVDETLEEQVRRMEDGERDIVDEDYLDPEDADSQIQLNYDQQEYFHDNVEEDIFADFDNIFIDTEEEMDKIQVEVYVDEKNRRYTLEKQIDNLLDELLSKIPTDKEIKKRCKKSIN